MPPSGPQLPVHAAPKPVELPCAERNRHWKDLEERPTSPGTVEDSEAGSFGEEWSALQDVEEESPLIEEHLLPVYEAPTCDILDEPLDAEGKENVANGKDFISGEKAFQRLLLEIALEHQRALALQKKELEQKLISPTPTIQQNSAPAALLTGATGLQVKGKPDNRPKKNRTVRLSPFDFSDWTSDDSDEQTNVNSRSSEGWNRVASILRLEERGKWPQIMSQVLDAVSALAIVLNAVTIGLAANTSVVTALKGEVEMKSGAAEYLSYGFTAWFVLELILRFYAAGCKGYFCSESWTWNLFDVFVVGSDVIQTCLEFLTPLLSKNQDQEGNAALQNLTVVRMLRILRITRAVRVLRIVRFFRELRMMVFSVLRSGSSLLWSLVLMTVTIYAFAVYFIQVVAFHAQSVPLDHSEHMIDLENMFGNLGRAEYTLYMAISGGISWGEVSAPLIEVDPLHGVVFCFYTFFMTFALVNIITGIFVETSISSARSSQEEVAQEQLFMTRGLMDEMNKIFQKADRDHSGTINLVEFEVWLRSKEVRAYLDALGIEIDTAKSLFELLDMDVSGEITAEEFTFGCLRLKGGAKSIDLATLMNHTRRMADQWRTFFKYSEDQFRRLHAFETRVEERLGLIVEDGSEPALQLRVTSPTEGSTSPG